MSFGSKSSRNSSKQGTDPAYIPRLPDASVLLAGLMGMRPTRNPALTNSFASGSGSSSAGGLGRRPNLAKRLILGGI